MGTLSLDQTDTYPDEECAVGDLLRRADGLDEATRVAIVEDARELVRLAREERPRPIFDSFLQEFGLSDPEGVALMCLAESILRIPDTATIDRLIAEKVRSGNWSKHRGRSDSLFVNASVWGMLLTGKIVRPDPSLGAEPSSWWRKLVSRLGEAAVRAAMHQAMRLLGSHYVLGSTIEEAIERGPKEYPAGTSFSFDMLGEGARTVADAEQYLAHYEKAIRVVGAENRSNGTANSVSIKLSALHPRFRERQRERILRELLPRLVRLAASARAAGLDLTIDAEEADRLPLCLELFEQLACHKELADWNGVGIVLQAYQKRALAVADWIVAFARETGRRIPVRLVKGAYWDTEIKHAQMLGLDDYPVYTRKSSTDLSWLLCAQKLIAAGPLVYPQFATHNAYSIAAVLRLTRKDQPFEIQRLHGMGDVLYAAFRKYCRDRGIPTPRVRVYAPVGSHRELLPYLVRRLLENGANGSFVNQLLNEKIPVESLVKDVVALVANGKPYANPSIPRPPDLYRSSGVPRANSRGLNLEDRRQSKALTTALSRLVNLEYRAAPSARVYPLSEEDSIVVSPAMTNRIVGRCRWSSANDVAQAMAEAAAAQPAWDAVGGKHRADVLEAVGRVLDAQRDELVHLICHEAGRTLDDALSEVREAVDFCNYYAALARRYFGAPQYLTSPTGESNRLTLHGRGVFACISPWNFPLAIFTGQTVAALAAGNAVAAKPAEQTPLVAAKTVELMHSAGIPKEVLQLLPGDGPNVGSAILLDQHLAGVAFTGSTATATHIHRALANREGPILPLIAETGGLNAMIADTSCLPEQLVDDVLTSAFLSAGQRCSALRVLFLPEDTAESILRMLAGACDELIVGHPLDPATDIGPVIDARALEDLRRHIARMSDISSLRYAYPESRLRKDGYYFGPHIIEIESMDVLEREVFGPILHVVRYPTGRVEHAIAQINRSGFGLTLGVHSRIEGCAEEIFVHTHVGNTYVNRNMVGAVVGVNPFGGQGLSGTGPKAGGPHYLIRFAVERTMTINTAAAGGNVELLARASTGTESGEAQDVWMAERGYN